MELEKSNDNIPQFELSTDDAFEECCGKVLITRKRVLVMHCSFCQKNLSCFDDFVNHLTTKHYQDTENEVIFNEGSDNESEYKLRCSSFDSSEEQEDEYARLSQIQRFAEVVIKPDFKEVQEDYFEEIEEVIINNGTYCGEKPADCDLKSAKIREHINKEIEADVDLNMEDLIVDFDLHKNINKTFDDFDVHSSNEKKNYNVDKFYRQYQFKEKQQLSTTENYTEPTPEAAFKCNICDKVFQYKHRLKKHLIIHSEERRHKCHLCGFAFKDNSNLRAHLTRHTKQKNISCEICSKKFFTRSEAKQHKRLHTGERPFICNTCGLDFVTSGALTMHTRRHNSEPTFKCNFCGKGFYGKADINDHMLVHTKEKPYVCHICAASFPRLKSMLRHTKLHTKST